MTCGTLIGVWFAAIAPANLYPTVFAYWGGSLFEGSHLPTRHPWKDAKKVGIWTHWYENGQQRDELFYLSGYIVSAIVWKTDGEKCSMTDV